MLISENSLQKIINAESVAKIFYEIYAARPEEEQHKEYFYVLGLDAQNRIKFIDLSSIGTVDRNAVYVREVFKILLLKNCVSGIVVHNHPSGVLTPSTSDRTITTTLCSAGKILDIKVLDHIIIGDHSFYSFADECMM